MKVLNPIIICFSVLTVVAFFMPWIKGAGSIAKPIDDSTKAIQDLEPTGVTKGIVKTTKGIADILTETLTPIRLKHTLAGYQIPISGNKEIKRIGPVVYLLYTLPVVAIICAIFSLMVNRKRMFSLFTFLIALALFILLYKQVSALNKEGLFVKIQACKGYWLTLYSFLGIVIASFIKLITSGKKYRKGSVI